jgi:sodium-dependent dicarboxylate transporter 2/3/5
MIVTGFLSGWISNTATTMLIVPIAAAVISQAQLHINSYNNTVKNNNNNNNNDHDHQSQNNFAVCLLLSVAYSASIGGMFTLIGTPPNAIFASLSESLLGKDISFGNWILMAAPISTITLLIAWFYMVNFGAKIKNTPIAEEKSIITDNLKKLGKMSLEEKIVAIVFAATATAWISRGLLWKDLIPMIDDSAIGLISAISLFIISSALKYASTKSNIHDNSRVHYNNNNKERIMIDKEPESNKTTSPIIDWNTAVKIPWGVLLLIGGGLALAGGFTETGLDKSIAEQLSFLKVMPYLLIIVIMVIVTVFAGEVISNTATAALLIPIAASLATSLSINPLMLMAPIAVATSIGFVMPVATPPNAIVFSTGYITVAKMARAGLPLDIIGIIVVTLLSSLLVPIVLK